MGVKCVGAFMYTAYFWARYKESCVARENIVFLPERGWPVFTFSYPKYIHTQTYRWITSVAAQLKEVLLKSLDQTHSARLSFQLLSTKTVLSNTLYIPFVPKPSSRRWRRERFSLANVIFDECFSYQPLPSRIWSWWKGDYRSRVVSIMRV